MHDIIIIGAGPAGLTAGLYALRSGKSVKIFEKESIGGQISTSPKVENYPSIKQISGMELATNMFEQVMELGIDFEYDEIKEIIKTSEGFTVKTDYDEFTSKAVIIATGVKHKKLNLPNEEELIGRGISYCATCDGPFFKDEDVAVIGDGNSAFQYALLLANYCKSVTICTLFDWFVADNALVEKAKSLNNVKIITDVSTKEYIISDNNDLSGLKFKNLKTNEESSINVKGCFIAIGQIPDNKIFANLVDLDDQGFIIANESCLTKTEGLFVCGDCRTKEVRQITTAASDGAIAATQAVKYIDK